MSNQISEDCSSRLHEYCTPCECECHKGCGCNIKDREENEPEREWFKRWMCMFHWMQTDYYKAKLKDGYE